MAILEGDKFFGLNCRSYIDRVSKKTAQTVSVRTSPNFHQF